MWMSDSGSSLIEKEKPTMTRVVLDKKTLAKLSKPARKVEIYDEEGNLVGIFAPIMDQGTNGSIEVPFTNEELDRFEKEQGGRTLAEILADLERRG
jgi:hypothetical protein